MKNNKKENEMDCYRENNECGGYFTSHAGYETLEGDIIRRFDEIMKLPEADRCYELGNLPQEIYDANSGQYDMETIEQIINANIGKR